MGALDVPHPIGILEGFAVVVNHHAHFSGRASGVRYVHALDAPYGLRGMQDYGQTFRNGHIGPAARGLAGVALGHVHQTVFIRIAGRGDMHRAAAHIGQGRFQDGVSIFRVGSLLVSIGRRAERFARSAVFFRPRARIGPRQPGDHDAGRNSAGRAVKLAEKAPDEFARLLQAQARPEKRGSVDQHALAYVYHAQSQTVRAGGQAQHVQIAASGQNHPLALDGLFDGPDLIAQFGGPLKVQGFGGLLHADPQQVQQLARLAFQQQGHLTRDVGVCLGRDASHTGSGTHVDMIV